MIDKLVAFDLQFRKNSPKLSTVIFYDIHFAYSNNVLNNWNYAFLELLPLLVLPFYVVNP